MRQIVLSSLPHVWIIDIDGTIIEHNSHRVPGKGNKLLNGVEEFWKKIPPNDMIILMTAREESYIESTLDFLAKSGIRFDKVVFGVPQGERILINDTKPSGLETALAINLERNEGLDGIAVAVKY